MEQKTGIYFEHSNSNNFYNKKRSRVRFNQHIVRRSLTNSRSLTTNETRLNFNSESINPSQNLITSAPATVSHSNYALFVVFSVLVSLILFISFILLIVYCCLKRKTNLYKSAATGANTNSFNNLAATTTTTTTTTSQYQQQLHRLSNFSLNPNYNSISNNNLSSHTSTTSIVPGLIGTTTTSAVERASSFISTSSSTNTSTTNISSTVTKPLKEICISLPLAKPHLNELKPQLSVESKMRAKTLIERRGSNNSLSLTLNTIKKKQPVMSPSKECTTLEYLSKASRILGINELIEISKDKNNLYNEFYNKAFSEKQKYIPFNHPETSVMGSGIKNRYKTIVPNESTRVKLPIRDNDPLSSYINANYMYGYQKENNEGEEENLFRTSSITSTTSPLNNAQSSLHSIPNHHRHHFNKRSPPAYIASQGPMSNTINDFWLMIWNERVSVVVMITKLIERNKNKCESYIPEQVSQSRVFDKFKVTVKQINHFQDYEVRQLEVQFNNETRFVYHYWYTAWPDHNLPDNPNTLIQLVKQVESTKSHHSDKIEPSANGPILVHCSAGVGRTGCFIAISIGIKQIEAENLVDIVQIVCRLRMDRGGMIQTLEQYEFIYQALAYYSIFYKKIPYTSTSSLRSPSVSVSSPSSMCLQNSTTTSSSFSFSNTQSIH